MKHTDNQPYSKNFCSKFDDPWYLSLNCTERGLFDQLIPWAKKNGDTGIITFKSWNHLGLTFGLDGKTARKFLGNFHQVGKVWVHYWSIEGSGREHLQEYSPDVPKTHHQIIHLNIENYYKWQRDMKVGNKRERGENSPTNKDKIREDKISIKKPAKKVSEKKEADPRINELKKYFSDVYMQKIATPYPISHAVDGATFKRLLQTYSLDQLKMMIDVYLTTTDDFICKTGRTISILGKANIATSMAIEASNKRKAEILLAKKKKEGAKETPPSTINRFG